MTLISNDVLADVQRREREREQAKQQNTQKAWSKYLNVLRGAESVRADTLEAILLVIGITTGEMAAHRKALADHAAAKLQVTTTDGLKALTDNEAATLAAHKKAEDEWLRKVALSATLEAMNAASKARNEADKTNREATEAMRKIETSHPELFQK